MKPDSNGKKENLALFTSASSGLAHYAAHLFNPLKKYVNPYYVTYADVLIDDLVKSKISKTYPLLKNQNASSVLMTLKFLKERKIKYINFHVGTTARKMFLYNVALLSQARLAGIKVVGTLHDVMPFATFYIDPAALELLYSCMDYYVVGNEAEYNKLQLFFNIPKEKISIIDHGPYTLFDNQKYTQKSARKHLGISEGKRVILFFGQLKPHKGLKYLLKAYKKISKNVEDTMLFISTDLAYSPELNELLKRVDRSGVSESIRLSKGYVPSDEIEAIFKAADLVVLPYTEVSQSGVLNLAYAFKKPVVVTDIFPDANLIDRRFGRVAKTENIASLEDMIIELLNSPSECADFGQAGYDYVTKNRSWDKAAEKMSELLKKI